MKRLKKKRRFGNNLTLPVLTSSVRHYLLAALAVIISSAICFLFVDYIGYQSENFTFYPMMGNKIKPRVIAVKHPNPVHGNNDEFWDTFITQISDVIEKEFSLIFNKFYRIEGSKTGGTGLGLSIAKGFTEAHQGTITDENRQNGGAKFTVRIPSDVPQDEFKG